ncbi:MAG TPA: DoxX-like family protein [Chthoniobacterales bacterium]
MTNENSERRLRTIYRLARSAVAGVWIYSGLVPKILFRDWSEMTLLSESGVETSLLPYVTHSVGLLEILFGLTILLLWKRRWPLWMTVGVMVGALISVAQHSPRTLHAAFNPVTTNGMLAALAIVTLWAAPPKKI